MLVWLRYREKSLPSLHWLQWLGLAGILAVFFALLWSAAVHEILTRRRTRLLDWIRPRVPTLVLSCIGLTILYGVLRIVLG